MFASAHLIDENSDTEEPSTEAVDKEAYGLEDDETSFYIVLLHFPCLCHIINAADYTREPIENIIEGSTSESQISREYNGYVLAKVMRSHLSKD